MGSEGDSRRRVDVALGGTAQCPGHDPDGGDVAWAGADPHNDPHTDSGDDSPAAVETRVRS